MAGLFLTLGKQLCPVAATTLTVCDPSFFDVLSKSPSPLTVTVNPHVGHGSWQAFSCLASPSTGFTSELGCTSKQRHQTEGLVWTPSLYRLVAAMARNYAKAGIVLFGVSCHTVRTRTQGPLTDCNALPA